MKLRALSILLVLLCGCGSEEKRFYRDMQDRYEVQCDKYYSNYDSGGVEDAKKALHDVIGLSLAEKGKAKFYWRFDIMIAFAQARLAVMAETQGDKGEATRLFAIASAYESTGEAAFNQDLRKSGINSTSVSTWTPDQWRKAIASLDQQHHVRWKSLNQSPEPSAVDAASSALRSTSQVGVGSGHGR